MARAVVFPVKKVSRAESEVEKHDVLKCRHEEHWGRRWARKRGSFSRNGYFSRAKSLWGKCSESCCFLKIEISTVL